MRRAWLVVLGLLAIALPASAQSEDEILDALELRGYYLDSGVDASIDQMEGLVSRYPGIHFVALDSEAPAGADLLAADLLDALGRGTVVVLTPEEVGAVSFEHSDEDLGAALDAVVATEASTYPEDFAEFAGTLTGEIAPPPTEEPESGGGFPTVLVLVGVGLVGLVGFGLYRSNRQQQETRAGRLEEARAEIRQQMDVVAGQIVALADDARVEENAEARQHYRAASETFQQAEDRLKAAANLVQLEDLSDDLDRARWELEATSALIEGRAPPPVPVDEKPQPCFFDPTHGAGIEEARLETPAGTRQVLVCAADAEKLRRGEAPQPRQIPMGPNAYPAPQAPRSSGGLGMDWLDIFSIVVGGMGRGMSYDWRPTPPRRSGGRIGLPFPRGRSMARASRSRGSMARGRRGR
jgi:hypothetical protein